MRVVKTLSYLVNLASEIKNPLNFYLRNFLNTSDGLYTLISFRKNSGYPLTPPVTTSTSVTITKI